MLRCVVMTGLANMRKACVYKGHGMFEKDSAILHRELTRHLEGASYTVTYISPEEIKEGKRLAEAKLLVIGGGFDLGLIKVLGQHGMSQIRNFVSAGGSYLGICSGAYFASDYIEFDKGGPLQVVGERFLKFYPGVCTGPLYKRYVYDSTEGAVAALINLPLNGDTGSADIYRETNISIVSDEVENGVHEDVKCNMIKSCDNFQIKTVENGVFKGGAVKHETKSTAVRNPSLENSAKRNGTSEGDIDGHEKTRGTNGCEIKNGIEITQDEVCTRVKKRSYCTTEKETNLTANRLQAKIYFNGGGHFIPQSMTSYLQSQDSHNTSANLESQNASTSTESNNTSTSKHKRLKTEKSKSDQHLATNSSHIQTLEDSGIEIAKFKDITVLSRYLDLPNQPVAMVKCKVGKGVAVLSGGHFDHAPKDIEDDNDEIRQVICDLNMFETERNTIFKDVLEHLNMSIATDNKT